MLKELELEIDFYIASEIDENAMMVKKLFRRSFLNIVYVKY